jgi:FkbM family methyltransferase
VIVQRGLLKLFEAGLLRGPVKPLLARRTWRVQAGEAAGLKFSFPQNLDFLRGSTERPVQRCVAAHLGPGDVFYDVGANVGFFSLLATKRVGPDGFVYALEPVAENASTVRRNARLNGLANVSVFEVAADATSGVGELLMTDWDGGSSLSDTSVAPNHPTERRAVRVIALDDLIEAERLRPPTVVKIDVEGAEMRVLDGMKRTIERFKPVLVYEVDDGDKAAFERRWQALDERVRGFGYRVTHLEPSYSNLHWQVGHSMAVPYARL